MVTQCKGEDDDNNLGSSASFALTFLIHIPEHSYILLLKAVKWHCGVSRLGTEHQQEHGPASWRKASLQHHPTLQRLGSSWKQSLAVP